MKKIGLLSQMDPVMDLPEEVKVAMEETLTILEESYGKDRDIEKDLGGYIAVVDGVSDIAELKEVYLDVQKDNAEWVDEINTVSGEIWVQALFVLSGDFSIVVVGKKEILGL